jgi:hypothetical protein
VIGHLWARHRWLLIGFVATLALALFFGARALVLTLYWSDHRDEAIAGWMTPRYVAMSWDVPPEVLGEALALERDGSGRRMTLVEIADAKGTDLRTLEAELEAAIVAFRAGR